MGRRSEDEVTLLGGVGRGAAQGTQVFTFAAGALIAAGKVIPRIAVGFPRLAEPCTRTLVPGEVTGCTVGIAGSCAAFGWVRF